MTTHPLVQAIRLKRRAIKSRAHPKIIQAIEVQVAKLAKETMSKLESTGLLSEIELS